MSGANWPAGIGVSFAASFDDPSADTGKQTQFYSMLGARALWRQGGRQPASAIDSEEARGVLFSQGSRFGGHALYVKDGKLAYGER